MGAVVAKKLIDAEGEIWVVEGAKIWVKDDIGF
jgi:hypothetical protein